MAEIKAGGHRIGEHGWELDSEPEPEPSAEAEGYESWTVEDLRAEASEREIEGRSELTTKADLIKALKKDDR